MKSVLTVVGARPQFIKAAPVSASFRRHGINEKIVHTGQHYDPNMSDLFFEELGLAAPAHHLGIGGGLHGEQTARMLRALEPILISENPDWVLVYGDTNSTLAGALVAAKLGIPVAHVEAGLRSNNRAMPEEINRIATDRISTVLFAPTHAAMETLAREGFPADAVTYSGDVMYDAALMFRESAGAGGGVGAARGLAGKPYVLATLHRAENTDDPARLGAIVAALDALTQEIAVILPLHPRTHKAVQALGLSLGRVTVLEPVGYLDMVRLLTGATLVATDSGGLQKEAYFFGVRCVTLRTETEWTELVEAGWNTLVPPVAAPAVLDGLVAVLGHDAPAEAPAFYGDGHAADVIARRLSQ